MSVFISWYLTVTLLGWLAFPLTYRLFPALADRGYSLSRTLGLLVWGYTFWLLTSLGISQNDVGGLLLALLVLVGLSVWGFGNRKSEIGDWFKKNLHLLRNVEILFFLAFAFLALVRASNPELTSAEKPMELMFINAILRSPTFPPHDAWLSGYAISYYYFGYVMTAMLAKLTGVPGTAAHNLMTALVFALGAIGAYGILYNLLATHRKSEFANRESFNSKILIADSRLSFLAPLFLLILSNAEGFLEVLHRLGLFWSDNTSKFWLWLKSIDTAGLVWNPSTTIFNFWTWLDIKELVNPPMQPLGWIPDRYLWWWRASRVISDYDLAGGFKEIIDEFPMFSFVHADLHPHVLAIPFGLLAIAAALNLYLGGWRGEVNLFGFRLQINWQGFAFLALLLGGLAFLNTWDILVAAGLIVGAYVLTRVTEAGWGWERGEDLLILSLPLGSLSILLYLPFYIGFSSQAGGPLPNIVYPTRGAQLWIMFLPLLLPLFAYLIYLWHGEKRSARWHLALSLSLGLTLALWAFSWLLGWLAVQIQGDVGTFFLQMNAVPDLKTLFVRAGLKRLASLGSLLTLLAGLIPALAFLLAKPKLQVIDDGLLSVIGRSSSFVLLLITLGTLLVLGPEFVYLRDQFGTRINTVFKFYYQAWMLWSLAAAFGVAVLLEKLRGAWDVVFRVLLFALLVVGLTFPVLGLLNRTDDFRLARAYDLIQSIRGSTEPVTRQALSSELRSLWTLDYFNQVQRQNPDEAAALRWLQNAPDGIVAEAIGGSYSGYGRVSVYTGLPTVLGWPGHEAQWRGSYAPQGSRQDDIKMLYAVADWQVASEIIIRYDIRYIYVGGLERTGKLQEEKFQRHLRVAFHQGDVTIYEVP